MNLPKPSSLSAKGDADQRINYILNYLTKLVDTLDKVVNTNGKKAAEQERVVKDIGYNSTTGNIAVRYTDGSVKYLDIGE